MKKLLFLLISFLLMFSSACLIEREDAIKILIPKIGKADCIIIYKNNDCVMIDTGESEDDAEIVSVMQENQINRIDTLIITHFDKDHVGGAAYLIDHFEIGRILRPVYTSGSDEYNAFMEAAFHKELQTEIIANKTSFHFVGIDFEVYPAEKNEYEKNADNNSSLVISAVYGENSLLFAGDAEKERLSELKDFGSYDFLKVPHHGSYNDETEAFINRTSAKYAVITCSDKNPPEKETVSLLKKAGAKVYETRNGNIEILMNEEKMQISQK